MRRVLLLFSATALIVSGAAGVFFVILQSFDARAGVQNVYATTCLGGWENVHLATGMPETKAAPDAVFTNENSARLNANTYAQIFCAFANEIIDDSAPRRILVRFSWDIQYRDIMMESPVPASAPTPEISAAEAGSLAAETIAPSGESAAADTAVPEAATGGAAHPENATGTAVEPTTESPQKAEVVAIETISEDVRLEANDGAAIEGGKVETETVQGEEVAIKAVEMESAVQTPEEQPVPPQNIPAEPKTTLASRSYSPIEVLYTIDGINWRSFGFVPKSNFSSVHFEIPIEEASNWKDISRIQISVKGVPTFDEIAPTVYLDSVWLEIEHQKLWEDARLPPGERDGDVIISESTHENMSVVLVKRTTLLPFRPQYELWISSATPASDNEPAIEDASQEPLESVAPPPPENELTEVSANESAPVVAGELFIAADQNTGNESAVPEPPVETERSGENNGNGSESVVSASPSDENTGGDPAPVAEQANETKSADISPDEKDTLPVPQQEPTKKEWRFITDHLLSANTRAQFVDGNLFWFEPGGNVIWRFNIGTNAFESVSVNDGETPRLYFRDSASQLRMFEKDAWGTTQILDVETDDVEVQ
jgi:hypothetical protein